MGPPGAGKGTQGAYLQERYELHPLSPGDLLRAEVARGSALGKEAQGYMNSGKLVPDDVILKLVANELDTLGEDRGFLLDGFPRTLAQAKALDGLLLVRNRALRAIVLMQLDDEVILQRLSQRLVCPKCKLSYNVVDNPPQVEGRCDQDQSELIQRQDDQPEVIRKRLEVYHESTAPLAEYYESSGLLDKINADQPIQAIKEQLQKRLDERLKKDG